MSRRNRRKSKRFQLDYPYCETAPEREGFCIIKDISLTGAHILHQDPPPIGTDIEIHFARDPIKGLKATGRVVRHNSKGDSGFGMEFIGPNMRLLVAAVGPQAN